MIIHDIEQNSPEWFSLRAGMPTGSMAKSLVTSQGKESKSLSEYAITLANDLFAGEPLDHWEGNSYTERGHELEPNARSLYEMIHKVEVEQVGFITDDEGLYGASPDSMINDDGLLEIKSLTAKRHTSAIIYYKKHNKPPTDYVSQIQMQLFITGRNWCDLMFYHPVLPELIIRVEPELSFQMVLIKQLNTVITERDRIIGILNE